MNELKPCPFCGGEATIDNDGGKYQAWCKHCCCIHMGEFYNTEAEAIAAWNRRADHIRDTTKKVSNADRIRKTTDEELAKMLVYGDVFYEEICGSDERTRVCDNDCMACALEWLQQPAKESVK